VCWRKQRFDLFADGMEITFKKELKIYEYPGVYLEGKD